jgi:tetratricopeptide (TPR) repeat protein
MGQFHACEARKVSTVIADFECHADALHIEAICCAEVGDYKRSFSLHNYARKLLNLCGMSQGFLDRAIMSSQAEAHRCKSEYSEASNIHTQILQETSLQQDPFGYGYTLLLSAEIKLCMGACKDDVWKNLNAARSVFTAVPFSLGVILCDSVIGALLLREGDTLAAKELFEKCLVSSCGHHANVLSYCLPQLSNMSCWDAINWTPRWPVVLLAYSLKSNQKLEIHKALQFIGDITLVLYDEDTAVSLFTTALEGFTEMDVHHSRAECMLRLGDICKKHDHLPKAIEYWTTARPLFERSSQGKQVENIDQRLASINQHVLEQHKNNLDCLTILNASTGASDDLSVVLSGIKDQSEMGTQMKV